MEQIGVQQVYEGSERRFARKSSFVCICIHLHTNVDIFQKSLRERLIDPLHTNEYNFNESYNEFPSVRMMYVLLWQFFA